MGGPSSGARHVERDGYSCVALHPSGPATASRARPSIPALIPSILPPISSILALIPSILPPHLAYRARPWPSQLRAGLRRGPNSSAELCLFSRVGIIQQSWVSSDKGERC